MNQERALASFRFPSALFIFVWERVVSPKLAPPVWLIPRMFEYISGAGLNQVHFSLVLWNGYGVAHEFNSRATP